MKKILTIVVSILIILFSFSCKKENTKISIACPQGAPSLALFDIASDIKNNTSDYSLTTLSSQTDVKAAFLSIDYDIIVSPINIGIQIYNQNQNYNLLCGLTFGNLYFCSKEKIEKLSDLNNKSLVLFGKGTINDTITKYILDSNSIHCNIEYVDSASTTKSLFVADTTNKVYMLAEPTKSASFSALKEKGIDSFSISVEEEFEKLTNTKGFAQAGVFVKNNLDNKKLNQFMSKLDDSVRILKDQTKIESNNKIIKELGYFNLSDIVMFDAIIGSNIDIVKGASMKEIVEKTYSINLNLVGELPDEAFYKDI